MSSEFLVYSIIMAAASGLFAWSCRGWVGVLLDYVERDVSARLRSMRIQTPHLRAYLAGWMYVMVVVFIGIWFGYGSPVFALLAMLLMGPLPWFLLVRMAERRRQQIEEQLSGSMTTLSLSLIHI